MTNLHPICFLNDSHFMQTEQSQTIVRRFFEALQYLKADKVIRGKRTFTKRYGINRWNFNTLEKDVSRDIFQVAWLTFLVTDYKVSPWWLLIGEGSFYLPGWDAEKVQKLHKPQNKISKNVQIVLYIHTNN